VISGLAFAPSAPLLVPAVAAGAAPELDDLRASCITALRRAIGSGVERIVIVGAGGRVREHRAGVGSFAGFGVDLEVLLDPADPAGGERLPLSLGIGAWLLAQVGWPGERAALEVDALADRATLAAVATALAGEPSRTVMLVVADGSAARSERAPASLHPDAASFDADVVAALASGLPSRLAAIDPDRAASVASSGWPAWHVAGTAAALGHDGAWDAEVHADVAPYGVGYVVASWCDDSRRSSGGP
jgi:hypothetical protein